MHLITIEDPIEYLFSDEVASIAQREIGTDTRDFSLALRNAMRQDPDVIMVGEMRDPETVRRSSPPLRPAIWSSRPCTPIALPRRSTEFWTTFPSQQQKQIRQQLAQTLKGVISMQLVERQDGEGRIAALEILRSTPRIAQLIEAGETKRLMHGRGRELGRVPQDADDEPVAAGACWCMAPSPIRRRCASRRSPRISHCSFAGCSPESKNEEAT